MLSSQDNLNQDPNEKQLKLLDVLGLSVNDKNHILFSPLKKAIIYSLGSNIIYYNLNTNLKTFVQYLNNNILIFKFLNIEENLLLTVDDSSFPVLTIWDLPSFKIVYNTDITTKYNFKTENIFVEQLYQDLFLILLILKDKKNLLYVLKHDNQNFTYSLELFGKIPQIQCDIYGFKVFYNSQDIIILLENNLLYFSIDFKNESIIQKMKIDFPFSLINNSLIISHDVNLISFLTSKGNCLIYDQNGNNKPVINPFGQEIYTSCFFAGDSLCLGTNHGKIYIFSIYENKPKYFIHFKAIIRIKENFQLNSTIFSRKKENILNVGDNFGNKFKNYNYGSGVKQIYLNEKTDIIFLVFEDNSILLAPITALIDDINNQYNLVSPEGNNTVLYCFNHSEKINNVIFTSKNNENDDENSVVFFSCSKDKTIIKYYIDLDTKKLSNSFFDLQEILSENNNNLNNKNYITILKSHPLYSNKLFAGDNKGFLYLFDIKENHFQYKRNIIGSYEIISLEFSPDGNLLCIGFDSGLKILCNMRKECEPCLQLSGHYMSPDESEFRKINNNIICFSYFFNKKNKNCVIYNKNNNFIEYSKLYYDRNKLQSEVLKNIRVAGEILDVKMHFSENYLIILSNDKKILIISIVIGITTAIIDLSESIYNIFNIQTDISGLYLSLNCKIENKNSNDVIIFEIGTGKIQNYILGISPPSEIIFDNNGEFLILAGENGEISLWELSKNMTMNIKNIIEEVSINENFWEQYEIKYNINYDEIYNNINPTTDNDMDIKSSVTNNILSGRNKSESNEIKLNKKYSFDNNYNKEINKNIQSNDYNYTHSNTNYNINNNDFSSPNPNDLSTYSNNNYYRRKNYENENNNKINLLKINENNNNKTMRAPLLLKSKDILKEAIESKDESYKRFNNTYTQHNQREQNKITLTNNSEINYKSSRTFPNNLVSDKGINLPKLRYINLFNSNNNFIPKKEENVFLNGNNFIENKTNLYKTNKSNKMNINAAINTLMENQSSNISKDVKKYNYNDESALNISHDFMVISNKKIENNLYQKGKNKKYPEPEDIDNDLVDVNLINKDFQLNEDSQFNLSNLSKITEIQE